MAFRTKAPTRSEEEELLHWQSQWTDEQVRQERCRSSFEKALAEAEASLVRRRSAFALRHKALASAKDTWQSYRCLAAWCSWLAAEKAGHQFAQLLEELRLEEDAHQSEQQAAAAKQSEICSWISEAHERRQELSQQRRAVAARCASWQCRREASWCRAVVFRKWSSWAHRAAKSRAQCSVSWDMERLAMALWAWHASVACSFYTQKRSELEAKEAGLQRWQRQEVKARLLTYITWRISRDVKEAHRRMVVAWRLCIASSRRIAAAPVRDTTRALAARAWAAWRDAHVQAEVAATCAEERSQAVLARASHCKQADALASRCLAWRSQWLAMSMLHRWWYLAQGRGLQRASDQLEQESQSSAAAARATQEDVDEQRDSLATARQARTLERAQLEGELADAQEELLRLNAEIAKETEGLNCLEADVQQNAALLALRGEDLSRALKAAAATR
ncbi:unnamed protein product [Effrenium voratum]|uniref:Uncharacterized protein n=1 Tax=Effrenium voratum TaxID=2562239 RepID=A0AA36J3L2_9DINO|nr:unnamed protein product [Effrenium voratum]